jgi:hypothetical protein
MSGRLHQGRRQLNGAGVSLIGAVGLVPTDASVLRNDIRDYKRASDFSRGAVAATLELSLHRGSRKPKRMQGAVETDLRREEFDIDRSSRDVRVKDDKTRGGR